MGNLLDTNGLTYFWNKIKSTFAKKTDYATGETAGVIKIGDGLNITDGALSVSGGGSPYIYMTQAEYETLTEYEQDKMYWVTYPVTNGHIVWKNGKAIEGFSIEYQNLLALEYRATYYNDKIILCKNVNVSSASSSSKSRYLKEVKYLETAKGCETLYAAYSSSFLGDGYSAYSNLIEAYINKSVKTINPECFYQTKLEKIHFDERNSEPLNIKLGCFAETKLEEIDLPEGSYFGAESGYYGYQFYKCESLKRVSLPSTISRIENTCFQGCTSLTSITINKPQDSISGSPWGATNATVIWNG